MKNISKCKGQRIIDRYRDGAEKLYALCESINKKAMLWYNLNIEFSADEVELIKRVQQTMEDMALIPNEVIKNEELYESLDLGYEMYTEDCADCDGKVKVIGFATNGMRHEFNIYKCEVCGGETTELFPNQNKHIKIHFKNFIDNMDKAIKSETLELKKKIELIDHKCEYLKLVKMIIENSECTVETIARVKKSILEEIETNGTTYKDILKYKYHFDKE